MKNLTVIAALGLVAVSSAQGAFEEPTNIAFRLGYVYPIDSTMRNISSSYLGVGVDLFPTGYSLFGKGETFISVDWFGKSGSGAKGNAFPILINQRIYNDGFEFGRTYFQFGAGVAVLDLTSTKTVLAAKAGFGKEFGENLFGEVNFVYTDSGGAARATSLGFYVGYKF